eukprot:SAG11_NODE_31798_length_289_cov_0.631579_1_plen_71_part_01
MRIYRGGVLEHDVVGQERRRGRVKCATGAAARAPGRCPLGFSTVTLNLVLVTAVTKKSVLIVMCIKNLMKL